MADNSGKPAVLVFADYFEPAVNAGGPIRSLAALTRLEMEGDILVVTRDRDLGEREPLSLEGAAGIWVQRDRARILYLNTRSPRHWLLLLRTARQRQPECIYVNSLFSPVFTLLPLVAFMIRLLPGRRMVIAPRGELASNAMAGHRGRKTAVVRLVRGLVSHRRVRWHATSPHELQDIRRHMGLRADVDVVLVPDTAVNGDPSGRSRTDPRPRSPLRLVQVARVSRMKNLLTTLQALDHVQHGVRLDLYGPLEEAQYWSRCQAVIATLPERHDVKYRGVLPHDQVAAVLEEADGFLLCTLGENFGHSIYESLTAGCPVILGRTTRWTQEVHGRAGWVVDEAQPRAIAAAIDALAGTSGSAWDALSSAAQEVAADYRRIATDPKPWNALFWDR